MSTKRAIEEKQNRFIIAVKMLAWLDGHLGVVTSSTVLEMLSEDAWQIAAKESGHKSGNPSDKTRELVFKLAVLREEHE